MDQRWNEEDWEKSVSIDMTLVCDMKSFMQKSQPMRSRYHALAAALKELGMRAR
jgi:hypothetical protein